MGAGREREQPSPPLPGARQICGALRQGTNAVLLDPDVAEKFPTSESVNEALRRLAGRGDGGGGGGP